MRIPNPIAMLSKWRDDRAVGKIRDQYRYSLSAYRKRHSATKEKDDKFFVLGIVGYLVMTVIAAYMDLIWLYLASFPMLLSAAFLPMGMSFYEQWVLKSKLTLTMKVVPNDPEQTRPITMRLEGVEFGAPMTTPDELIDFVIEKKGHLTKKKKHLFRMPRKKTTESNQTSMKSEEAERVMKTLDKDTKLYPMMAKGDPVPTLIQFSEDPEAVLRPREEKVRLGYGLAKLRHATVTALECDPVKTSVQAKDKIVDVEYALFTPLVTQKAIDDWLEFGSWHVPTRITQEVATFVKQKVDVTKNASYFTVLEKQRDDAIRGREKLQLQNKSEQMNADLDGEMMRGYKPKSKTYALNDIIMWMIVAILVVAVLVWAVFG